MAIAGVVCLFCSFWGLLFTADIGMYISDIVDHYLNTYPL
jgi:hypothetical protein